MFAAVIIALFVGLSLGLLGGGGSTLAVPLLIYVVGLSDKSAIATSLLVVAITSGVAAIAHARAGNVRWRGALTFAPSAMLGAYVGGFLARYIPGPVLIGLFAVMMLITASAMWRKRPEETLPLAAIRSAWVILPLGLLVGMVTGLVGAGGGFLVVPALALVMAMPMRAAIATSLVVIAANSSAALLGYVSHVSLDYGLALVVTSFASLSALVGARLATRVNAQTLRRGFSVLVLLMGVVLLTRAIRPLLT